VKLRSIAAVLVLAILAAACANSSATPPGDGGTGGGLPYPTGASDLVLRIDTSGGFVGQMVTQGQIPGFSLFGDGRVIMTGAQIEIYPQPALPPVLVTTVDADGIQTILQAAIDAGLDVDADYTDLGSTMIADAATTTFTLSVNGETHVVRVYALSELGSKPESMSKAEFDARTAFMAFWTKLGDLRGFVGAGSVSDDAPYVTDEMRLYVNDYQPDPSLQEPAIDWPVSGPLASFGEPSENFDARCGTVSGEELAALMPLAEQANQLTPWRSDGAKFGLVFRPLLPDESGC
jgi:hypothetical protein